jgi:acyl carrier protein
MPEDTIVSNDSIEALVIEFIADELIEDKDQTIDVNENLFTSGLVDSIGIVRLIAHLQHQLGVDVPRTDLVPENFRTIRVMATYLQGLLEN